MVLENSILQHVLGASFFPGPSTQEATLENGKEEPSRRSDLSKEGSGEVGLLLRDMSTLHSTRNATSIFVIRKFSGRVHLIDCSTDLL